MKTKILLLLAAFLSLDIRAADVAISALPAASSVSGTDTTVIVQSGTTKKAAVSLILNNNVATATALAANPADCSSNTFATTIAANGDLTCAAVTSAGISGAVAPSKGGTGVVNNDSSTITISGSFPLSLTLSASTSLTAPTSGTIMTTANSSTFTTPALGGILWWSSTASNGNANNAVITGPVCGNGTSAPAACSTTGSGSVLLSAGTAAITSGKTLTVSNTMTQTATDGSTVAFGGGGTVAYTVASGSTALATSAIASGACNTASTGVTATGTATTDAITWAFNADPTSTTGYSPSSSGMLTIIVYPTANAVNFKVCNNTANSITPGAVTLNWRVVR